MKQAFVIMQIGDTQLDDVYTSAIVPAIEEAGLVAKRVDKHNEGKLLKSEIVDFIGQSEVIVADLTNERPNCYLEVGYAMGLGKYRNLIMTAREDHYDRSSKYRPDGPRIHFDLTGYDIIFWDPQNLEKFKSDLIKKMRGRLSVVTKIKKNDMDEDWLKQNREKALEGLKKTGRKAYLELIANIQEELNKTPQELLKASEYAQVHTFGWPIGVSLNNRPELKTRPVAMGIQTDIAIIDENPQESHYDFWTITRNGDVHLLKSLFEENRKPDQIFFDTRIIRITEIFMYLSRLYYSLEAKPESKVTVTIKHSGIEGRFLGAGSQGRFPMHSRIASVNEVSSTVVTTVEELETKIVDHVKKVTKELFTVFDFFELDDSVLEPIVTNYVNGRIT